MKKLYPLAIAVALGLLGLGTGTLRAVNTNTALVTFQISGAIQKTTSVTNSGVETTTYTTTPIKIGNAEIMNMLQAEFSTTFPTGAQLGYNAVGDLGFRVLDQNQNVILNVSTNPANSSYVFALSNSVAGGGYQSYYIGKAVNNTVTSNATQVITAYSPDYGIYYKDAQGNDFHMDGLLVLKANLTQTPSNTVYSTVSFTITGSGGGTFFNPADGLYDTGVFTKARMTAAGKNLIQ